MLEGFTSEQKIGLTVFLVLFVPGILTMCVVEIIKTIRKK